MSRTIKDAPARLGKHKDVVYGHEHIDGYYRWHGIGKKIAGEELKSALVKSHKSRDRCAPYLNEYVGSYPTSSWSKAEIKMARRMMRQQNRLATSNLIKQANSLDDLSEIDDFDYNYDDEPQAILW